MLIIKVIDLPDNKAASLFWPACILRQLWAPAVVNTRDTWKAHLSSVWMIDFAGRWSPHLALNKTSLQHPQPQLTLATQLALLITQLPIMTCIKLSSPASLDISLMLLPMLHHCIYFLIEVNRIYYFVCTRWLLVLIPLWLRATQEEGVSVSWADIRCFGLFGPKEHL